MVFKGQNKYEKIIKKDKKDGKLTQENIEKRGKEYIENLINQAFDKLLEEYEMERKNLLLKIDDLQKQNQKLKNILDEIFYGKQLSRKDFVLHRIKGD